MEIPPFITMPTIQFAGFLASAFCIGAGFCLILHGDLFGFRRMK